MHLFFIHACTHAYPPTYITNRLHARITCKHACQHAQMQTLIYAYKHEYIQLRIHARTLAYLPTYLPTNIHTFHPYMRAYIHEKTYLPPPTPSYSVSIRCLGVVVQLYLSPRTQPPDMLAPSNALASLSETLIGQSKVKSSAAAAADGKSLQFLRTRILSIIWSPSIGWRQNRQFELAESSARNSEQDDVQVRSLTCPSGVRMLCEIIVPAKFCCCNNTQSLHLCRRDPSRL